MSDHETRIALLESELIKLKAQNRRTRAALPLVLLVAAVPFLVAGTGSQQVTRAEKFEVTKDGKVVATLGSNAEGGTLEIYNNAGAMMSRSSVTSVGTEGNQSGAASYYNSANKRIVWLTSTVDGHGSISAFNKDGQEVVWLAADGGNALAEFYNKSGKQVLSMGAGSSDQGFFALSDKDEKLLIQLTTTDMGQGSIKIKNFDGQDVAWLSAFTDGSGMVRVNSKSGKEAVTVGASTSGGGYAKFMNSNDVRVVWLGASSGNTGQIDIYNASGTHVGWLAADTAGFGQLSLRHSSGSEALMANCNNDGGWMSLKTPSGSVRWVAP